MRAIVALLLCLLLITLTGCGATFVGGVLNTTTVTGTVSIVRLTVTGNGTQVTFVTLIQMPGSQDFNFCGNQVNQFPINTRVEARFTPGTPCNSGVSVVIVL